MIEQLVSDLYDKLIMSCPVDTGEMQTSISLSDYGDYYQIDINVFYAQYVNYNRQRTSKERKNYKWVERVIEEVGQMYGAVIELGG